MHAEPATGCVEAGNRAQLQGSPPGGWARWRGCGGGTQPYREMCGVQSTSILGQTVCLLFLKGCPVRCNLCTLYLASAGRHPAAHARLSPVRAAKQARLAAPSPPLGRPGRAEPSEGGARDEEFKDDGGI